MGTVKFWHRLPALCLALATATSVAGVARAGSGVWTSGGPYGGSVWALAIDPKEPATLYAGTNDGGIFKSTDSGSTWAAANTGLWHRKIRSLAIDPATSSTLYAGTHGSGVFKSTDSGASWTVTNSGLESRLVWALAIDPKDPATLYAGTYGGGVSKSTDSGGTWFASGTGVTGLYLHTLAINPTTPATVYVGTEAGVFASTDAGSTWIARNTGLTDREVYSLAVNPAAPSTLFAGTSDAGVFRSTDSGGTWIAASSGLTSPFVAALAMDRASPTTLYAGGRGVFMSTDSGDTWVNLSTELTDLYVYSLAINPATPATLHAGTIGGGIFRSTDSGLTWAAENGGLTGLRVHALAIDPMVPSTVYAGMYDKGLYKTIDSGTTWVRARNGPQRDVSCIAIDPTNPATLYAGGSGLSRSTDGGATWVELNPGPAWVRAIAIDPRTPTTLYAGAGDWEVFKSTDSGDTWVAANSRTTAVNALAVDPSNPAIVIAAGAGISKSTDSGATWNATRGPGATIETLAIDPTNPTKVYAGAFYAGVFKSTDSGTTWAAARAGLPPDQFLTVTGLVVNPTTPSVLYAGIRDLGVFRSTDSGSTWAPVNGGLSNLTVEALALDATGATTLYAGFEYGSVWQSTPPPPPSPTVLESLVPIVLDAVGASARFTTELVLTNSGPASQNVTLTYAPALGSKSGGGSVSVPLSAGQQAVYPDVLSTLRALGLPIPAAESSGPQGGPLVVSHDSSIGRVHAAARTTSATVAPQPVGRAGVAYGGVTSPDARNYGYVFALRSNVADRSNLALYNPGRKSLTVKVTLFPGSGGEPAVLSDMVTLPPRGWTQFNDPLAGAGMANGWAMIVATSQWATFDAYGVINDNATNDGSFVPMIPAGTTASRLTLPVLVETDTYESEIVLANGGSTSVLLTLQYVESRSPALGPGGLVSVTLAPREQRIIPGAIDFLRASGATIGPKGAGHYAGALRVTVTGTLLSEVFVGARTAAPSPAGGQFGAFTPAVYEGQEASDSATIHGLRSDAFTRSNVAVVNAGTDGAGPVSLELAAHDGSDGGRVRRTLTLVVRPGEWIQPSGFFGDSGVANGYVTITRLAGTAPWIAYGVVNDGSSPGQRTGDGAYVPMVR